MPKCLSSGAHASIVYDFFDLIVTLAGNSQSNMMSGKKTCKVCGLWAFHPIRKLENGMPCFERGMFEWVPAADAMYHLLLSFLKALPPPQKGKNQKHLPDPITSLLRNNEDYPPPQTTAINTSRSLQEVPMVTLKVNNPSKTPAELLARVARTLRFDDATIFYTREDYLLLKRLFKDVNNLTDKLSTEGSRILDNMCIYDEDMVSDGVTGKNQIKFKLIPGWSTDMTADRFDDIQTPLAESNTVNNNNNSNTGTSSSSAKKKVKPRQTDFFTANVSRASIDDYFIWTWLASLGLEQTSEKKKTFGKTYIMEVQLAEGFKKWVIVEEQDVTKDGYDIELELKQERLRELKEAIKLQEKKLKVLKNDNLKIAGSSDDNDLDTLDQTIIDGIAGLGISSSSNPKKSHMKRERYHQPHIITTINIMRR
ncbi:unnamed protein product [[Candida] boidinii]|nr:unnamed protein product [[Candida] boidinii]